METGQPSGGCPYKSAKLGCVRVNSSEAEKIYSRRFLHFRQNLSTKNNTMQIKTIISFAKIPPP
ncbi:TPA: hypothetical protein ACFRHA_002366, partial [Neisseria subflava]